MPRTSFAVVSTRRHLKALPPKRCQTIIGDCNRFCAFSTIHLTRKGRGTSDRIGELNLPLRSVRSLSPKSAVPFLACYLAFGFASLVRLPDPAGGLRRCRTGSRGKCFWPSGYAAKHCCFTKVPH